MKIYELLYLFNLEIAKVKQKLANSPTIKYIMIAYATVLQKIKNTFNFNQLATAARINALDITQHMKDKLIDITDTKITKRQEEVISDWRDKEKLRMELMSMIGIGNKKINELIDLGLKSVKQLTQKKYFNLLNLDTQITILHKPEREIPHADIKKIEPMITGFGKTDIIITGSFRRKKPILRDIDILFVETAASKKAAPLINDYISYLKKTFNDKVWIYAQGDDKVSLILQYKQKKYKADIFITTPDNFYAQLLYTTGSKNNNIEMRAKAKKLGLLLNQNGIFRGTKKINKTIDDEKTLYALLDMPYKTPEKRI